MIAGTRVQSTGNKNYHSDPLYAYGKQFAEACNSILATESMDLFTEPKRAIRSQAVKESLKDFYCNNFVDEAAEGKTAEEIEDECQDVKEMFENDMNGILENTFATEYAPMVGMALPIHKLILMNNVFAQGGGIQKAVAVQPSFTVSMERRILVTPDGKEIDIFLDQNSITDAIEATAPTMQFELEVPQKGEFDLIGELGGTSMDEISTSSHVSGIYVENVYIAEGDRLPDADGWYTTKGEIATAETAGKKNVWFHVEIPFTPTYGGPNRLERAFNKPITVKYKTDAEGTVATLDDILFGALDNNKLVVTALKGNIKKIRFAAKLNTSNAMQELCSTKWKIDTDYVEIPEATPVNTTISAEELKDVAAMYDANQVTKIISNTKTILSEYKDMKIKRFMDRSYERMDERVGGYGEFDFAPAEGYALDWVTYRQATFMDYLDDLSTKMMQVLNDPNMTITVYGDPRIVRKITPTEYTYQSPSNIGAVRLDYTQTIVNNKDNFIYNFVGSDKFRNTNQLMIILNPRNSERICYRIYDYQLYMSNEIRNSANPSLPAIHSFERFLMYEFQPVQSRINILNPSGQRK